MPAYNEGRTISQIIARVLEQPSVFELIIVNDCSSDDTWTVLQGLAKADERIRLFQHEVNRGKGAGLRTGFAQARGPIVVVQDADLEYDPAEYPRLLRPMNFPPGTPGFGSVVVDGNGLKLGVINALGRTFMGPQTDNPFLQIEQEIQK